MKARDGSEATQRSGIIRRVGDYELLEEIARGGMGVVYCARQVSLNRLVAVKVMRAAESAGDAHRFRREAEIAASLTHPNIVSIYEVGEHDGQPFFSMELIEGRNLAELSRDQPLGARRAAALTKTIAEAVHYAHQRRLLHRDLKPSNVLVDASDMPHVTDFGLAKRSDSEAGITLTGQVLGTPNYMSPEQAEPSRGPTTVSSDVYSLGAILYQLVSGRPPFMAETVTQTLRQVTDNDAVSPRVLNPSVPRDLETICARCLEKDPRRRYASAEDLAEELGRFLKDEPIRARRIGLVARVARWCHRKPALALSLSAGIVLLLVIAVGSAIAAVRFNEARKQEAALRARAEAAERETEQQLHAALLEQARATLVSGEVGHRVRALDALRRAAAISNAAELRREVFGALALPDLRFERELAFDPRVTNVHLDPTFERLAMGRGKGSVEIRAVADQRLLASLPASTNLPSFYREWSADGRFLAVKRDYPDSGRRADWEVWNVAEARRILLLKNGSYCGFSFHPRLPRVIAYQRGEGVTIWNLEDGRELIRFPQISQTGILRFSPDGDRFASLSVRVPGLIVSVYDAGKPDSPPLAVSPVITEDINAFTWHPDGSWLAVPDHGNSVHRMDARTGEIRLIGRHKLNAVRAVFSPDGAYLFTGGWERELVCWDGRTGRRVFSASLNSDTIQFSADGRRCAVITQTNLQLHAFEQPAAHREFTEDLGGLLRQAAFSPDGRWLAASGDKRIGLWDLAGGGPGVLTDEGSNTRLYFTPDTRELFATRNSQGTPACFRWQITPSTNTAVPPLLTRLPLHKPRGFVYLCLNSNSIVVTGTNGTQILAPSELEKGSDRWVPTQAGLNGVSPDGRWLGIYRSYGTSLYVYRLPGLEPVAKLTHPASFGDFQFSPAGDEVAIGSLRTSTRVEFWSTTTWERTRTLTNFGRILYAPDSRAFWLIKDQRAAGLYNARTLEPLLLLPAGMLPLALSPNGQHVAVSVNAQRLQIWDLAALRAQLRQLGLDWSSELDGTRRDGSAEHR